MTNKSKYYTLQGYDLRSFKETIYHDRSTNNADTKTIQAKQQLYELIGEDQLIWCSCSKPTLLTTNLGQFLHEIKIDYRDKVFVIDTFLWSHILGYDESYILNEDLDILKYKAMKSNQDYDESLRKLTDSFLKKIPPRDKIWSSVLKAKTTKSSDQILIKFPFHFSSITNVVEITKDKLRYKL